MSLILTAHDLSTGTVYSSVVTGINGIWTISATTTGCPERQVTRMEIFVAGADGNYYPFMRDGKKVSFAIMGNDTQGITLPEMNSTTAKVYVRTINGASGSLSIDSVVDTGSANVTTITDALTDGSQETKLVDEAGNFLYPSGSPASDSAEITRPANITAYTALDAIGRLAAAVAQVETITLTGTAPTLNKWTVTLTGTSGTANVTVIGGLTKLATFNGTLGTTASDFVTAHAAAYLVVDITLTASGSDLIFESTTYDTQLDAPVVVNVSGDLAGTAAETTPLVVVGEATVTGTGGVNALISFDISTTIDLAATAALFEAAYVGDYATEGITLTSSGADIIFTAASPGTSFIAPIVTTTIGDLVGTVEHTTANDNPDVLEFTGMCSNTGGGGYLMDVKIESDIVAIASTTVRVWFYNATPSVIIPDNSAFNHVYLDRNTRLFYVDVTMDAQDGSSASIVGQTSVMKEYNCAATSLFAQVQTVTGFTPTSGGKVNVTVNVLKIT